MTDTLKMSNSRARSYAREFQTERSVILKARWSVLDSFESILADRAHTSQRSYVDN